MELSKGQNFNDKTKNSKFSFIVIEGNIGAGKTSLSTLLAKKHNAQLIQEQFSDNPFLPKFYANPSKYSFQLEMSFLANRYRQLHKELNNRELFKTFTISDYYFTKSLIFSRQTLQDAEFQLYRQFFNIIYPSLPKPDLYVYLHVEIEKLLSHINNRGRVYEKSISKEYLIKIQKAYFDYMNKNKQFNILILNVNDLDFVNKEKGLLKIEEVIFNVDTTKDRKQIVNL